MARPRNNIARLAAEIRIRIAELLDDGATHDAIRADDQVAAACKAAGVELHGSSFLAYQASAEFAEFRERRRQWRDDSERDRMAAAMINAEGGLRDMADVAAYELMRKAMDQIKHGELGSQDLAHLGKVLKDSVSRDWQKERALLLAKIAELSATITRLSQSKESGIDSNRVADKLDEALGLKR